jgi:hypothetical protein
MPCENVELTVESCDIAVATVKDFGDGGVLEDGTKSVVSTESVVPAFDDVEDVNQRRRFTVPVDGDLNEADVPVAAQTRTLEVDRDTEPWRGTQPVA